jgi:hypothetical protein
MAKNKARGDDRRVGAVKGRSQIKNAAASALTQRSNKTGRFADPKSTKVMERTVERFADAMKSLAKR